jgi:hypothetical protein
MDVSRHNSDVRISNEWSWRLYTVTEARELIKEINAVINEIEKEAE